MSIETLGHGMTDRDYVEYLLDVKDGQIVGCEFSGEGRQVEPLTEPKLFVPVGSVVYLRWLERIERRVKMAFRNLVK